MSIFVSGSLVYDTIMDFPDRFKNHILPESIHILNVSFSVGRIGKNKGGTAGNIAYNLKLLGAEPVIVSTLGKDGGEYLDYFKKNRIRVDGITLENDNYSASCFITTDLDDNQITAFYGGALAKLPEARIASLPEKPSWAIISPTEKSVMLSHIKDCAEAGIKTIFDPGQQITSFSRGELVSSIEKADALVGNDYEIKMIGKKTGWSEEEIVENAGMLVMTFGAEGSVIRNNQKEEIRVEACRPSEVLDPTGAGDAYRAGFLLGLEKGYNLRMCARLGSVAASFAIEKHGTQEHRFDAKRFSDRYSECYREDINL